jgi:hypothetical protein
VLTEQQVLHGIRDGSFSAATGGEILLLIKAAESAKRLLIRALETPTPSKSTLREAVSEALAPWLSKLNPDHDFAVTDIVKAINDL